MRTQLIAAVVSLYAASVVAQGTLLFTWHGTPTSSGFDYQASFMVPYEVMSLGAPNNDWPASDQAVMAQTINVTDSWGGHFSQTSCDVLVNGRGGWANWSVVFGLTDSNTGMTVTSDYVYGQGGEWDTTLPGVGTVFYEPGYWDFDLVPEPSAGSLLLLGGLAWALKERRAKISNLCGVADRCD